VKRRLVRWVARGEAPAAWALLVGAAVTLVAVVLDLVATGTAKWATLLVAADLLVSSASALREAYSDELDEAT